MLSPATPKSSGDSPAGNVSSFSGGTASAESVGAEEVVAAPLKRTNTAAKARPEAPRRRGRPRIDQEKRQIKARPEEMSRALSLLAELVRTFGGSRRYFDQVLGAGRNRTNQILSGRVALKFQHILNVLDVLEIESRAFFEVLYGEDASTALPASLAVVFLQKTRAIGSPSDLEATARVGGTRRPSRKSLTEKLRRLA